MDHAHRSIEERKGKVLREQWQWQQIQMRAKEVVRAKAAGLEALEVSLAHSSDLNDAVRAGLRQLEATRRWQRPAAQQVPGAHR